MKQTPQMLQDQNPTKNQHEMDVKKLNIPTLDSPNWGTYVTCLQAAFQIFDCYNVVKGEILTPRPQPNI